MASKTDLVQIFQFLDELKKEHLDNIDATEEQRVTVMRECLKACKMVNPKFDIDDWHKLMTDAEASEQVYNDMQKAHGISIRNWQAMIALTILYCVNYKSNVLLILPPGHGKSPILDYAAWLLHKEMGFA